MVSVTVHIDDDRAGAMRKLADAAGVSLQELVANLVNVSNDPLDVAIGLFQAKRVSMGRAAELAGLSVAEFIEELRIRDAFVIDHSDEDDAW